MIRGGLDSRPLGCRRGTGHGSAWRQGFGAGGSGPRAVLRHDPGGLRSSGRARRPAGLRRGREPLGPGQALARAGPEAAARSRRVAAHVRKRGRAAGALPLR